MTAIVAMAENRVIGANGGIPWHLPEDLKFFKRTTLGHVVVMGRTTFESIGRPLPGRENIVLSRSGFAADGIRVVSDPSAIRDPGDGRGIFVIGGTQIYIALLPQCDTILMTFVKGRFEGDVCFPLFEAEFSERETLIEDARMRIVRFERIHR